MAKVRVLFVCYGNICRSPMAEAVFAHRVKEAGLEDRIETDSAGTGDWHAGEPPHRRTRQVLDREGIPCGGRARVIRMQDLDEFDYVVAMDAENLAALRSMMRSGQRARVSRLLDHAPDLSDRDVPDPYYTGDFDQTYRLVSAGVDRLLQTIRKEHGL
jgi:protein-tyrosine phosphatase